MAEESQSIVALAGGVGGARMADGLALASSADAVTVIVNVADDFELYGLRICPDLDTVMYNLAGIAHPEQGWGIAGDTQSVNDAIASYGEETWFLVSDRDFATHILRTDWIGQGERLTDITSKLARGLGVESRILPATDDWVATIVETAAGDLAFQDYFVRRRHQDEVTGLRFDGIEFAEPTDETTAALREADMIVICPSNPYLSIDPILMLPGLREVLEARQAPAVAISPIIGGKAIKGPADRLMAAFGAEQSAVGVARHYQGLIDGFVIDDTDRALAGEIESLGLEVLVTQTIMRNKGDRMALGKSVISFAESLTDA